MSANLIGIDSDRDSCITVLTTTGQLIVIAKPCVFSMVQRYESNHGTQIETVSCTKEPPNNRGVTRIFKGVFNAVSGSYPRTSLRPYSRVLPTRGLRPLGV